MGVSYFCLFRVLAFWALALRGQVALAIFAALLLKGRILSRVEEDGTGPVFRTFCKAERAQREAVLLGALR